jgi:putative ABC transport system permease protein
MNLWNWLFHRRRREEELDEEVQAHLRMATQERVSQGETAEQARASATREFGNVILVKETTRDMWGFQWLETLLQDFRFALRMLRKNPGFTAVAILTLALGIGANTAIFSLIDAALLRPLPYDQPELLVTISTMHLNGNGIVISPDFKAWQKQNGVLDAIGAFGLGFNGYSQGANLTGVGEPVRVNVVPVTVGFFQMLGVRPILGRSFNSDEEQPEHSHVALVSGAVWRRDFSGDRGVLNKIIHLDKTPYTIIGVMPAGLLYPPGDLWVPEVLDASNSLPQSKDWPMLYVIGRLKPGVSLAKAQADLEVVTHHLDTQFSPGRKMTRARWHVEIVPLRQLLAGDVGHLLLILLGAVGFVLLIACANLANLLLARAAARGREVAVRSALGASRFRLVRQFLAESALLATCGGALGGMVGVPAERALQRLVPPDIPASISLDPRIFAFVIATSVGAVVLFGLVPAIAASQVNVNQALKESGSGAGLGRGTHRLRGLLVVAETALALILLTGAGLMARSLLRLTEVDLGFDPHHLLLGEVWLSATLVDEPQREANFFHEALERVRALPGVENAASTTHYPVSTFNALVSGVLISGGPSAESNKPVSIAYVSPDYFRTLRIRLLKGRFFNDQDGSDARNVAILTESEARNAFGGREAVGQEINLSGAKGPWRAVVGVVADSRNYTLEREPWPEIFIPYQQQPSLFMTFVLRTKDDPMRLAASLRQAVASIDANEPVGNIQTMDDIVQKFVAPQGFKLLLLGSFAGLALVLGAVGLCGVISYAVTERTHEIGVRRALGAQRNDVLKLIIGHGFKLALTGIGIGILGALALTRFLSTLLYGVKPTDPLTYVSVSLLLLIVALLAAYIPARRATKVDPMVALRYE